MGCLQILRFPSGLGKLLDPLRDGVKKVSGRAPAPPIAKKKLGNLKKLTDTLATLVTTSLVIGGQGGRARLLFDTVRALPPK